MPKRIAESLVRRGYIEEPELRRCEPSDAVLCGLQDRLACAFFIDQLL